MNPHPWSVIAITATSLLTLAACSNDRDSQATPEPTVESTAPTSSEAPTTTPTTTAAPTTTENPEAAVAAIVNEFNEAYAAASDPFDPDHPLLRAHASGEILDRIQRVFGQNADEDLVSTGEYIVGTQIEVTFEDQSTARLVACTLDEIQIVDRDGNVRVPASTEANLSFVLLRLESDGAWRVFDEGFVGDNPEQCEL